jgi:predicted nucleic acid-binding protein
VIVYFDTSALVPLLVAEPSSARCRELWDIADVAVASRLGHVEAAAALAQAVRAGRVDESAHKLALERLDELWRSVAAVEIDASLMRRASELAALHALRGYYAVHAASAELVADESTVAASGDRALLRAWRALGLSTSDTRL